MPELVYHTRKKEFRGDSAAAVVDALHADNQQATGWNIMQWWSYQQELWLDRYRLKIPERNEANADQILLDALVQVGALKLGKMPARDSAEEKQAGNGR